jgi:nitrogen regulatory protein PII
MKKIEAVIYPSRLDKVRHELSRRGLSNLFALTQVRQQEPSRKTEDKSVELQPLQIRVKVELVISDQQSNAAIDIILKNAVIRAPNGDTSAYSGHLILLNIDESLRISAGENG